MTKTLIIIRGPSGSGKSTLAHGIVGSELSSSPSLCIFEADQFFYKNGKYEFDANKLGAAHGDCQRRLQVAMENSDYETLVVSNTSMTRWELNPYLALARKYGFEVKILKIKGPWDAALFASRNKHNVPLEIIQKQIARYQPHADEIEHDGQ